MTRKQEPSHLTLSISKIQLSKQRIRLPSLDLEMAVHLGVKFPMAKSCGVKTFLQFKSMNVFSAEF